MIVPNRDDVQARAAAILADKYADPWLKLARYEELTEDLLTRLADAERAEETLDRISAALDSPYQKEGTP